jgi:hypothetical protein
MTVINISNKMAEMMCAVELMTAPRFGIAEA